VYRRTDRHDEANSHFSQFDASNKKNFFCHFYQTEKLSITQVENFVETRLLRVAQNQADSKQRDKIFIICFESPTVGKELNKRKRGLKDKDNPTLKLHRFLVLYYYYYYYYYLRHYYYYYICFFSFMQVI